MFLKVAKYKNGKTFLSLIQGYRDKSGLVKQKTIEKLGYLDDLKKVFDDPISHFKKVAKEKNKDEINELVIKNLNCKQLTDNDKIKNLGYIVLKKIYSELNLKSLLDNKQRDTNINYNLSSILELLVYSRIMFPSSKKETFENKELFFNDFNFSLHDIYRSLDYFNNLKKDIEACIWTNTKDTYKRDASTAYYDCTNYYFEISYNDEDLIDEDGNIIEKGLRKKGASKENRKDPIVQLGLLTDKNAIPLTFDLFPGNESEKTTLRPILKRTKAKFNLGRVITVADRGLNTSDNTAFVSGKNNGNNNDGYVFGQSVLGSNSEFKEYVLKQDAYIVDDEINEEGMVIKFKHKSRVFAKTTQIVKNGKRNSKFDIYQRQMVYYSDKYARKQKRDRDLVILKAKDLIANPGRYNKATSFGVSNYINNLKFIKETGEISNGLKLSLKLDKIAEEEKYDGYYSIVTSELNLSDKEIRDIYKGLWKIEEAFKITKSNFESRPVFVWTKEHIEAHFLTCFISLVIIKLLEIKLNNKFSINKIITTLKKYTCSNIEYDIYLFNHYDEIIKYLELTFNINLSSKYLTLSKIKKILNF